MVGTRRFRPLSAAFGAPWSGIGSILTARPIAPRVPRHGLSAGRWRGEATIEKVLQRPKLIRRLTAHRLGVEPQRSIAIEDSGPGIAAARAAGMKAVAIPHWLTARHDLSGADLTVAHAGELTLDRLADLYR